MPCMAGVARMFGAVLVGTLISGCSTWSMLDLFGRNSKKQDKAQMLTAEEVSDLSSSGPMTLHEARLILDNDGAFQSKLNLIRNAESEIRLIYDKYSDDLSSSVFTQELITATKDRNLKVKILVDFWTNYERLDLFSYLQKSGEGKIEVRFYGVPSEEIQRGARYETSKCKSQDPAATCPLASENSWFSKIYLTGLYGRTPGLMRLAKDLSKTFSSPPVSKEMTELADKVLAANLSDDVDTEDTLNLTVQTQGSPLTPWLDAFRGGALFDGENVQYLQHVTDLAHQRVLVVDGFRFQIGGRSLSDDDGIQNADFYGESAAALNIQGAFDRLFGFSPMVSDLAKVQTIVPNDYLMNPAGFQKSLALCLLAMKNSARDLENCVDANLSHMEGFESLSDRLAAVEQDLKANVAQYNKVKGNSGNTLTARTWKKTGDELDNKDLSIAKGYFLENLTFTKKDPGSRLFEPVTENAAENGKYIHSVLAKSLEHTCAISHALKTRKRVIIQTESFLLPSGLLQTLGKMMNGQWKCQYVDIAIITNPTTAENPQPASIFSRFQVQSLLRFQSLSHHEATLKFYEYRAGDNEPEALFQTNLALLGDDLLVGSVNGTVRSYTLDLESAFLLKNALETVRAYEAHIDSQIAEGHLVDKTEHYKTATAEELQKQGFDVVKNLIPKWNSSVPISEIGTELASMTNFLLQPMNLQKQKRAPASEGNSTTGAANTSQRHNQQWKSF